MGYSSMGIKAQGILVALTTIALLGAGCIGQDAAVDSSGTPDGAVGGANQTIEYAVNLTGSLSAPYPFWPDPTGTGMAPDAAQEGTHYNLHVLTLNATTSHITITLSWDAQSTPNGIAVPDLDMVLYGPDGADLTAGMGATQAQPETIELDGPFEAGDYTLRVGLYAGAPASYAADVLVTEGGAAPAAEESAA